MIVLDERNYYTKQDFSNVTHSLSATDKILLVCLTESNNMWPIGHDEKPFFNNFFSTIDDEIEVIILLSELDGKKRMKTFMEKMNIKNKVEIYVFPFYLIQNLWFKKFITEIIDHETPVKKTKKCICLVAEPKNYRLMFLSKFYKNNYFEYSFNPLYSLYDCNFNRDINPIIPYEFNIEKNKIKMREEKCVEFFHIEKTVNLSYNLKYENNFYPLKNIKKLTEYEFLPAKQYDNLTLEEIKKITYEQAEKDRYGFDFFVPKETFKTFFDINLESYLENVIFITEKTFKSLSFKRPFISFGNKNFNYYLNKLGFELYDELFDYTFDSEEHIANRFDKFVIEIERLLQIEFDELEKIVKTLQEKIEYNYELLNNKNKEKQIISKFIKNPKNLNILKICENYGNIF